MMAMNYLFLVMGVLTVAFAVYYLFWGRFPKSCLGESAPAAGAIPMFILGLALIGLGVWGFFL